VIVPKVELLDGSDVKSRTRLGDAEEPTVESTNNTEYAKVFWIGEPRFSGPGAPSRCPAPALVPLVSTKIKSAALLSVSFGVGPVGQGPRVVIDPPLPQLSRTKEYSMLKGVSAG